MRVVGEGEALPAAKTDVAAPAAVNGKGVEGPSGIPLAVNSEGVAATLAETMRSPWQTPPALVVDLEPLRSLRKLMIQARYNNKKRCGPALLHNLPFLFSFGLVSIRLGFACFSVLCSGANKQNNFFF